VDSAEIYGAIKKSGGSGRGVSYWAVAALCGRKAALAAQHPDIDSFGESTALSVGSYYHALKEMWLTGQFAEDLIIDVEPTLDLEWAEAVRLFAWHREMFPKGYWGQPVAVELKMPINDEHKAKVVDWIGHDESTGQCDLVVKMSAQDVARIQEDRSIELAGPGVYIIDHKTSGMRKSEMDARASYTQSLQAKKYMFMLGLAFNEPVQGMIFDVLVKHKQLRRYDEGRNGASVQTFFTRPGQEDGRVVRAAIDFGKGARDRAEPNPFACFDYGRECVFLSKGICGRY
jgi:hypothetical protein